MIRTAVFILTCMLCVACSKKESLAQLKAQSPGPSSPVSPSEDLSPDIPLCIEPKISDVDKDWSLPLQVYSANDFEAHVPLKYCTNGSCASDTLPVACTSITIFHDFTIYNETNATFFNSITEDIEVNVYKKEIILTSDTTGHKGMIFKYKFIKDSKEWEVTYGPNCGRRYQYALGYTP